MEGIDELFVVAWMLFGILLTPLFFMVTIYDNTLNFIPMVNSVLFRYSLNFIY